MPNSKTTIIFESLPIKISTYLERINQNFTCLQVLFQVIPVLRFANFINVGALQLQTHDNNNMLNMIKLRSIHQNSCLLVLTPSNRLCNCSERFN